jgi:putative phage-type endonuclease
MIEQGTDEWKQQRLGKVTASRISDVTAKTKTGWGASRNNYMAELLVERLTGNPTDSYKSPAMQWGTDQEPVARAAYEFMHDCTVDACGFIEHPTLAMTGASPDGLIGADGLVEIKCPNTATHIETLSGGTVPGAYIAQIQWQLACTNRKWCDWVSFDPRMPAAMQLFVHRVERDDKHIAEIEKAVADFLEELDGKITALNARYGTQEAAE